MLWLLLMFSPIPFHCPPSQLSSCRQPLHTVTCFHILPLSCSPAPSTSHLPLEIDLSLLLSLVSPFLLFLRSVVCKVPCGAAVLRYLNGFPHAHLPCGVAAVYLSSCSSLEPQCLSWGAAYSRCVRDKRCGMQRWVRRKASPSRTPGLIIHQRHSDGNTYRVRWAQKRKLLTGGLEIQLWTTLCSSSAFSWWIN